MQILDYNNDGSIKFHELRDAVIDIYKERQALVGIDKYVLE